MYKAILWDNDGVLVNTEPIYYQACNETFALYDIPFSYDDYLHYSLVKGVAAYELAEKKGYSEAEFEKIRLERDDHYLKLLGDKELMTTALIPETEKVLKTLHGKLLMGVVSSSKRIHFERIHEHTGYRKYFDFELLREDYKKAKPDPEPYLLALKQTKLKASECLVIEDSYRGIMAAKAAGLDCWVIKHPFTSEREISIADELIENFEEINHNLTDGEKI